MPAGIVDITAPVSGVITDQEVTQAASVQAYSSPNPFTISDLTSVWVVCDVYESDMANVRVGESADIKLSAYSGRMIKGKVSNIGAILDPNIRTAKVRLEVPNPATCYGRACLPRRLSTVSIRKPSRPYRRPQFCICTIATGSLFPCREDSVEPRSPAERYCQTTCKKS